MKFTFKTDKPTGKWRGFYPTFYKVKLNGIECGSIDEKEPHSIRLQVIKKDILEDGNPNCKWKWITLNRKSTSVDDAKEWLNGNIERILEKYTLHLNNTK